MRRFEARSETPYKAWKLTDEDWRNREKWDLYEEAINDMILKTSTLTAPWTIVEGDCKWYARVKTLRTLVHLLSEELDYVPPDPLSKVDRAKQKAEQDQGMKKKKKKKTRSQNGKGRKARKRRARNSLGLDQTVMGDTE